MDLEVDKFFHNFKIIKECGTGGYGKVYLVEDILGCVVNRFVLYYANVKKGCRENGECIRTT